ncbi:MAG: NADH-quinone oxidoreductase subunit A [Chthoniobacterales bacterium]|nr:NADH-quinone oxidoreductase subunit A [Chthoniobacterales bacterium]
MLTEQYLPLALHILVGVGLAAAIFVASLLLGRVGKRTPAKDMAYECGMPVGEAATPRFSVKFYLVAMLFILFDIEVVFMYPWAVVYRDFLAQHGSIIFWSMTGFITVLTIGYVYAIKKGALDWRN